MWQQDCPPSGHNSGGGSLQDGMSSVLFGGKTAGLGEFFATVTALHIKHNP